MNQPSWVVCMLCMLVARMMKGSDVVVEGKINRDTLLCPLKIFVPFTFQGVTTTKNVSQGSHSTGFSHMAAAWMAMEHFNARDASVVPELAQEFYRDCQVKFDMGGSGGGGGNRNESVRGTAFFDTSSEGHQANQLLIQSTRGAGEGYLPCALVGPHHEGPALNIATMAATARVPHIPSGGVNARLSEDIFSRYTSVIYPRIFDIVGCLLRFLSLHQRTNYIVSLYSYTDTAAQFQKGIGAGLDALNATRRQEIGFLSPTHPMPIIGQTIFDSLRKVKHSGFRTIIVTMDNFVFDLPILADAAEELRMNTEDYMWVFLPPFVESVQGFLELPESLRKMLDPPLPPYTNVQKFLTGAALILPVEGFQVQPAQDRFAQAWTSVNESFVERLNTQATVIDAQGIYQAGEYEKATVEYFQTNAPEPGSGFLYDAVMTVGLGACGAERQYAANESMANHTYISSEEQIAGMRAVNFRGSSGQIEFGVSAGVFGNITSARSSEHLVVGIFNLFPPVDKDNRDGRHKRGDKSFVLTATYSGLLSQGELPGIIQNNGDLFEFIRIDEYHPFYFPDGTTTAPLPLRDPPNQNYLSPALRYVGLSMMALALLCCFLFGIWVFVNRSHRVVLASQPHFLYLLIIGTAITSLSIFGISTDENWGFSVEQLSMQCMAIVWLASIGHIVTYGALFTKLWRVNKVLQFSRRRINSTHLAWPSAMLMVAAVTILAVWQSLDPLRWVRVEVDPLTGESIGQCDSDTMIYYIIALAIILMIPTCLVAFMANKTKDVDDSYSESSWIFTLIVIHLQVIIVAFPLVVVLRDVSTDGKYIGLVLLLWSMPVSTILLIMVPKVVTHYNAVNGLDRPSTTIRGSGGGAVRVSGLPTTNNVALGSSGFRAPPVENCQDNGDEITQG